MAGSVVMGEEMVARESEIDAEALRAERLLARVRHLQLEAARAGRFVESARYARRARRLREVGALACA